MSRAQARALSEVARVQEYSRAARRSRCAPAREARGVRARKAGDQRLQAALQLRLADTL